MTPPDLIAIASPIGNLSDITPRTREALESAAFWIVEDSRVSGKLQSALEIKRPMATLNDHARPEVIQSLVSRIREEGPAALVTDAGTPSVSDPGALLIDACLEEGLVVDALPGPSAVTLALTLSGFFAQRFAFLGFLPRKPGPIRAVLEPFADSPMTLVLFESPHRFRAVLQEAAGVLGSRRYAVCREMTKLHQQVFRERLPHIPTEKEVPGKGEFTLVIEGMRRGDLLSENDV